MARLSASLLALRMEHEAAIGWAQEYSKPRPGEAVSPAAGGAGAAVAAPASVTNITNDTTIHTEIHGITDVDDLVKKIVPKVARQVRRRQNK